MMPDAKNNFVLFRNLIIMTVFELFIIPVKCYLSKVAIIHTSTNKPFNHVMNFLMNQLKEKFKERDNFCQASKPDE